MNQILHSPASHSVRRQAYAAIAFLCLATPAALHANWNRTAAGTYEYTAASNWTSGSLNGTFGNAIAGPQEITFEKDWNLTTNGLRFNYTTPQDLIFRSDSATARTITFADANTIIGIGSNGTGDATAMRTVTLGTDSNPLIFDLGSNARTHTIRPGENTNFLINAKITGGHADGWLAIQSKTSATAGYISLTNSESDFASNILITAARPFIISSVADAGMASSIGAGNAIRFGNGSRADLIYTGGEGSTNRTIELQSQAVRIFNEGTGKLTFSGAFTRSSSSNIELRFSATNDIEVSGTIADSTEGGALSVSKGEFGTLILSGTNNAFSGGIDAVTGWVNFASVANTGTNSSLGSAGSIRVGNTNITGNSTPGGIRYVGSEDVFTDRSLVINEAIISNDGLGAIAFTGEVSSIGDGGRTLTLSGTNKGFNRIAGDISDGNGVAAVRSIAKKEEGLWVLEGNNSYSGATAVEEGTLLINGVHTGEGLVSVAAGAAIGGVGSLAGDLILDADAEFVFSIAGPLTVEGNVWLDASFGVASLLGLDASIAEGVYTLISSSSTDFGLLGISNWGIENAYDLGNGRSAYFQEGSLQLVVIPESGTLNLLGISGLLFGGLHWRRVRQSTRKSA